MIRTWYRTESGLKLNIPIRRMCPGHSAPFEFISDAFFGVAQNQLVKAPRGGSKTFQFALLSHLGMRYLGAKHPLGILSIGAIERQALNCIAYSSSFWNQPEFAPEIGRGMLKQSIHHPNGSKLEIVVATMSGVNGPHVPWLHIDEFELWDWNIAQQAFSIPQTAGPHRGCTRIASTQKFALGNMQKFIEDAPAKGFKYYAWCIWETLEQCRDRACSSCPIFSWPDLEGGELCGGRAKDCRGYYTIDDFISNVKKLDRRVLEEEWLCLRPSREGLVFGREYREEIHRVRYELPYSPQLPLFILIDQGWTNPFAIELVQFDEHRQELRFIGEVYKTETLAEELGPETADLLEMLNVPPTTKIIQISDAEDPAAARTFAKHLQSKKGAKYNTQLRWDHRKEEIEDKLARCRRRMKVAAGVAPRLIISSRVKWLPYELTQYRYPTAKRADRPTSEKPVDKDNHAVSSWYRFESYLEGPPLARSSPERYM